MSGGLSVDLAALGSCQTTLGSEAGQFGGIGDGFPQQAPAVADFGSLPSSKRLAQLAGQLSSAGSSQFSAAETFLRAAERGISEVQQNYAAAEKANTSQAKGA